MDIMTVSSKIRRRLLKERRQELPNFLGHPGRVRTGIGVLEPVTTVVRAPGDRETVLAARVGRADVFAGFRPGQGVDRAPVGLRELIGLGVLTAVLPGPERAQLGDRRRRRE